MTGRFSVRVGPMPGRPVDVIGDSDVRRSRPTAIGPTDCRRHGRRIDGRSRIRRAAIGIASVRCQSFRNTTATPLMPTSPPIVQVAA